MKKMSYEDVLDDFHDVIDDEPDGLALIKFDEEDGHLKYATRLPVEEEDLLDYLVHLLEQRKREISGSSFRVEEELR